MSETEAAWAAGFFDGEGTTYFAVTKKKDRPSPSGTLRVQVSQKFRDPLDRFTAAVGVGKVYGPYYLHGRTRFEYRAVGAAAHTALAAMRPYLSRIKIEQADGTVAREINFRKGA